MERRGKNGGFNGYPLFLLLPLLAIDIGLLFDSVAGDVHRSWSHRHWRMETMMASVAAGSAPSASPSPTPQAISSSTRVYHVSDYGADPTGKTDSTAAIARAISDAFAAPSGLQLFHGITDLGGAEIHLDGGAYLITSPITLPSKGGGNLKIHSGSLRASDDFPTNRYVIELWSSPSSSAEDRALDVSALLSTSGYNYEYVTLRDLVVDSNYRGGGIAIVNSLRTTVDNCYIVHFESNGIWVKGGHETFIRGSYIGQHITAGGDPEERNFSGVGINLMGNDNAVTDTVIFSAATGILVSGQANTFTGVHCYNKATGFGGIGIYLKLPGYTQTRIINCYMDYTSIVAEDPLQLVISGSFFLGDGNVVFKSVKGTMKDVYVVDNLFSGTGKGVDIVRLDETNGQFTNIDAVVVERNGADGMTARSTIAKTVAVGNETTWTADFSSVLLFPNRIGHVQYTLQAESGFPNHALRVVSGNQVVVQSDVEVKATVHVTVDQSGGNS